MRMLEDISFDSGKVITFLGSKRSDLASLAHEIDEEETTKGRNVVTIPLGLVSGLLKDYVYKTSENTDVYNNFQSIKYREENLFNSVNNLIIIEDLSGLTIEQEKYIFNKNYKAAVVVLYYTENALVRSAFNVDKHAKYIMEGSNTVIFARKYVQESYSLLELH